MMRSSGAKHRNPRKITSNRPNLYRVIWILSIGVSACIITVIGALLGTMGVLKQARNRASEQLNNQWESKCFVFQQISIPHSCNQCHQSNCTTTTTICYDHKFKVSYRIYDGTEMLSTISINETSTNKQDIQVGREYTCYYDRSGDCRSVTWDRIQLRSQTIIIGLGIALMLAAFVILISLGIYIIYIERPRLEQFKRRNQMLRHLSDEH